METRNTFAERLVILRNEKGLTQGALAESIGISRQSVTLYENHTRVPDIEILARFAEFFGVSADYLLGLSDNRTNENAAIGDELGLTDKTILTLKWHKEQAEKGETEDDLTKAQEFFVKSSQQYIDTVNVLLNQYLLMCKLSDYIFSNESDFVQKYKSLYIDAEYVDVGRIVGEDEKRFKDLLERKLGEESQAINMYWIQIYLRAVREEIIKQKEILNNAKKD